MIKVGLDIATKATGVVIQKDNEKPIKYTTIYATGNDQIKRINEMVKKIYEFLDNETFDILIVSKATHAFTQDIITLIEGAIIALAITQDIDFDYYPDSAWYNKIGNSKDERSTKKVNSLRRFIVRNELQNEIAEIDKKWSGSKLDKVSAILKDGTIITDDIADAYNAADLYEKRLIDYKIKMEAEQTQQKINKLRKTNTQISKKQDLIKQKIKQRKMEKVNFEKQYQVNGAKSALNSVNKRLKYIQVLKTDYNTLEATKTANKDEIEALRKSKNG